MAKGPSLLRRLAAGDWRLVLAVGGGWRQLVVTSWWLAAVGGWRLVGGPWGLSLEAVLNKKNLGS